MLLYYKTPKLKAQRMRISPPGIDHVTGSGWGRFSSLGIWLKGLNESCERGAPPVRMRPPRASWEL